MKLFVWDFHGVLERGNELATLETSNQILKEEGFKEQFTEDEILSLYGKKWHEFFEYLLPNESHETHIKLQNKCFERGRNPDLILKHIKPNDHSIEVLTKIKDKHHQILLSNTNPEALPIFIKSVNMTTFFNDKNAFAMDGHSKKDNLTKKEALKKYLENKTYDEIIIIGDSKGDMELKDVCNGKTYLYTHPYLKKRNYKADYQINNLQLLEKEI